MQIWNEAIGRMQQRMEDTRERVGKEYPHWADPETGKWTTTVDGDWTGGHWAGMHWLAAKHTGEEHYRTQAAALAQGLKNRIAVETVFKASPLAGERHGVLLRCRICLLYTSPSPRD